MNNRVAILCDTENLASNQANLELLQQVDFIHVHPYPTDKGGEFNNCAGYEGDPFFIRFPFQAQTEVEDGVMPSINKVSISIVAIKAGKQDFVVESKVFNCALSQTINGVQRLGFTGNRGYVSFPGDPYNYVSLKNNNKYNSGTMQGYELHYGFVLRYEWWKSVNATGTDIANDIAILNQAWHNFQQNGWGLVVRIAIDMVGYDGAITTFPFQTSITISAVGSPSGQDLNYVPTTLYYDSDGDAVNGPVSGEVTRIRTIWTSNGFAGQVGASFYGFAWADIFGTGSVFTRRFASTEHVSEVDSPFSDAGEMQYQDEAVPNQYANGGVRIGWYTTGANIGMVIMETLFDDSINNWGKKNTGLIPVMRLGFKQVSGAIDTEAGIAIESESGQTIIQE